MRKVVTICVRAVLVGSAAGLCTAGTLWLGEGLTAATHGLIMGVGALLFAVSEGFFARLLTELNGVLRAGGYSVWQAERLRGLIRPFKAKLWRLWWTSQGLKIVSGVCAVILQKQVVPVGRVQILLWIGYSALFLATGCTAWSVRGFLYVEKARDDLALEEVSIREKRRLSGEIGKGDAHDFGGDSHLQGYSKPSEPI
jgi:hypothetical protein